MDDIISTKEWQLFRHVSAFQTLWVAWQKVLGNCGGAGGDGVSLAAFQRTAPARLTGLAAALTAGSYRPGPYRHVAIPKKHGGTRPLAIPCIADRVVQTATATVLTPVIEPMLSADSYAYRPGKSVGKAVEAIVRARRDGYRWTAEGDVERCFEEIPHAPLLATLAAACGDAALCDLVALWLECFAPAGVGIPQGSPISPLLCNLHLDAVDDAMAGHGVRIIRFADDFVLLTKSEVAATAAIERMAGLLRMAGLSLNPDKTHIRAFDQSLRFLGHVFTRGMAWKEIEVDDAPAFPDAPPEDLLARYEAASPDPVEEDAGAARAARRNVLYIVESGCRLTTRNEAFLVETHSTAGTEGDDGTGRPGARGTMQVHASRVDRVEIGPGSEASWDALALAAAHGVPIAMADGWGQTTGWWSGTGDLRGERMLAQARWLADAARRDTLATALVRGRVRNQRAMLRRLNRARKDADIAAAAIAIDRVVQTLRRTATLPLDTARGYEGLAGAHYWKALKPVFDPGFGYDGKRTRHPAPDPVNACLNYLAALLERDIRVAIERAGLHPGMGSLHVARAGSEALIYDLMEAFRAPVVEGVLTAMAGRRIVRPDQFTILGTGPTTRQCRIERGTRKALIENYESWLGRTIRSRRTGQNILWRALFEEEARAMLALFTGDADAFIPYELDH